MKDLACVALKGFNTKQWWAYSEKLDVFIDPPYEVLEEIEEIPEDEQEKYFNDILEKNPSWLFDEDYHYDDVEI